MNICADPTFDFIFLTGPYPPDWCLSMIVHSFQTAWWHCHMDLSPCLVFPNPEGEFTGPGTPTLGKPPGCWWRLLVHGSWRVIAQAKSLSQPQVTADDTDLLLISQAWISASLVISCDAASFWAGSDRGFASASCMQLCLRGERSSGFQSLRYRRACGVILAFWDVPISGRGTVLAEQSRMGSWSAASLLINAHRRVLLMPSW